MSTPTHTRPAPGKGVSLRRGLAVGLTASMAAVGAVAAVPTAHAATGAIAYTCTLPLNLGTTTLVVNTDTAAPERMYVGDTAAMTSASALPGDLAQLAQGGLQAERFSGTLNVAVSEAPANRTFALTIPETPLGDQTTPTDVPFTATGTYTAATPGTQEPKGGDITADLVFHKADGTTAPFTVPCKQATGPAAVIDKIAIVARSTTTLAVDRSWSRYGETVTATARVTTTGGAPEGDVAFTLDGVATKARVDKDGVATFALPTAPVGSHTLSAAFVPRDATSYEGSSTAPLTLKVAKAKTRPRVSVTGKRTKRATRVTVKVNTQFGTIATGRVRIVVRRIGTKKMWVRNRSLKDGQRTVGFGKLAKGRYKVIVRYRGDDNHMRGPKAVRKFRVKKS